MFQLAWVSECELFLVVQDKLAIYNINNQALVPEFWGLLCILNRLVRTNYLN